MCIRDRGNYFGFYSAAFYQLWCTGRKECSLYFPSAVSDRRVSDNLDDVRDNEDHSLAGSGQLLQGLHADGVADGLQGGVVQAVPVLGQAGGIGYRLAGDENVGAVGQLFNENL